MKIVVKLRAKIALGNKKGTTSDHCLTTGRNVELFSGGGPEPASVQHVGVTCE